MGKRRFAQVSTSDEDEDDGPRRSRRLRGSGGESGDGPRERKNPERDGRKSRRSNGDGGGDGKEAAEADGSGDGDAVEGVQDDAKPIGEPVRVSGKGKRKKNHFASFEYDSNVFELEDPVLLSPEDPAKKPYVAIIKDITQDNEGSLMVTGQWFYRPEEADKKGGGRWEGRDTRELFYSFHVDDVPAESVMHKCVVHFVPPNKKWPVRKQNPGFIVQKVYDTLEKKLWKLTDKDYEEGKQHEIDLLVQKTRERLGGFIDLEPEDAPVDNVDQPASKRSQRRKNMNPIVVSRADDLTTRPDQLVKADTPGSCTGDVLKYHAILSQFKALTGNSIRDKCLDRLLQGITTACNPKENTASDDKGPSTTNPSEGTATNNISTTVGTASIDNCLNDAEKCYPLDVVVPAIASLERVAYEALDSDQKYNQKMRQLIFNLKNNPVLARRLVNKELEPGVMLFMSPNELKAGLTAEEKTSMEPEEQKQLQMTDARCKRCAEKKVGLLDIIHAGGHGDRYQLECVACGYTWYAPRDVVSSLTIDAPSVAGNVGTAPWATAKFEDVAKKLVSPREPEKPGADVFEKSTAAYMPVLETQKSFDRSRPDDGAAPAANRE